MKKTLFIFVLLLLSLAKTTAQNSYVYYPKTMDASREGSIELYFSNYVDGDVILIKNEADSLIRKITLKSSSNLHIEAFEKRVGNLKIYPHKAANGNPSETICFDIQGVLDKQSKNFCLSGVRSMYLLVDIDHTDDATTESGKLTFIFNNIEAKAYRVDIRHDLDCGRKARADNIVVGKEKYKLSTDGQNYKSECNFKIEKDEKMSFDITFESNRKGDEKMICLVVVLANLDTGERSSKSIRLKRKATAHYDIVLKSIN